jgi:bacterioferritin
MRPTGPLARRAFFAKIGSTEVAAGTVRPLPARLQPFTTEATPMSEKPFLTDARTLRTRARQHLEQGAVTPAYRADRGVVLRLLNDALATELVCVLRYRRHHFRAAGIQSRPIARTFLAYAIEEQRHADAIARRIVELGGSPDFSPDELSSRSYAEYVEGGSLAEMIKEDLINERVTVDSYGEMVRYIADGDPTTRQLLERILAVEEQQAASLASLLLDGNHR